MVVGNEQFSETQTFDKLAMLYCRFFNTDTNRHATN